MSEKLNKSIDKRSCQGSEQRNIKSVLKKRSPSPYHRRTPSGKKVVFNMNAVETKEFSAAEKLQSSSQNLPPKIPQAAVAKEVTHSKVTGQKSSSNCLIKINNEKFTSESKNNMDFTKSPINVLDIL